MLFFLDYNYNTGKWNVEPVNNSQYFGSVKFVDYYINHIHDWDTKLIVCSF